MKDIDLHSTLVILSIVKVVSDSGSPPYVNARCAISLASDQRDAKENPAYQSGVSKQSFLTQECFAQRGPDQNKIARRVSGIIRISGAGPRTRGDSGDSRFWITGILVTRYQIIHSSGCERLAGRTES